MAFSHELDADRIHWFSHLKWRSMKTLTCLGPRCTGVAPGHRCRCAAPPTSLLTPADTAAGRRPSWKTTLGKSARRSQTWRWLQWAHPLPTEREDYTGQVCQTFLMIDTGGAIVWDQKCWLVRLTAGESRLKPACLCMSSQLDILVFVISNPALQR